MSIAHVMTIEGTNNTPEMEAVPAVAPPQVAAVPSSSTSAPPQHQHQQQHADAIADSKNGILQTLPPSHILEDGRFIYLPPPNAAERSRFFERSIARHGLLESDMNSSDRKAVADDTKEQQREEKEAKKAQEQAKKDKTEPKIHPLWIASARLESGMNELNRAINLATLVNMNEFFTYTNVVDPRQANAAATATTVGTNATTATATADTGGVGGPPIPQPSSSSGVSKTNPASAAAAAASLAATQEQEQSRQVESLFCLKRKRQQFEQASRQLKRHQKRLRAGVYAQRVVDRRLFQLRKLGWKLVLPEHGTRARLHAPRTNEVVAVDVDLYNSGHESTAGNEKEHNRNTRSYRRKISQAGRMASRVPRFATIELKDDFNVLSYQKTVMKKDKLSSTMPDKRSKQKMCDDDDNNDEDTDGRKDEHMGDKSDDDVEMGCEDSPDDNRGVEKADNDSDRMEHSGENDTDHTEKFTRAEPFAVADPTLGRVQENFDPSKIPMLNLQIEIHKSSTGFVQLARLEPPQTNDSGADDAKKSHSSNSELDEELLASLQHSLFCANLFESMRSELDTEDEIDEPSVFAVGRGRTNKGLQNMAWLASESDKNYVAPPSFLVGDHSRGGEQSALSVIHCHDGEVKVQLDSEYTLCIKLVEANADDALPPNKSSSSITSNRNSGSQSPEQLHVLCRALLLHAQEVQHGYSLEIQRLKRINEKKEMDPKQGISMGFVGGVGSQSELPPKPSILKSCVSLGSKMLFERRIRNTLVKVDDWVQSVCGEKICIQWSPLSIFDLHSQFSIGFRNVALDVSISGPSMVVTRIANGATYRKVCFRSEEEFEVYLKLELRRADI
mmetsp:Transcript_39708/g.95819  ORF Transcript_39708/g.95819 Transcript_39708/m.95819 type:complete len:844 (-) Transcript_39708:36-2567(-)